MSVCATSQFTTNGGVLGLDRSAMSRVVARSRVESVGDGPHGPHRPLQVVPADDWAKTPQTLKTMIDQRVHWKNDYGVPVLVQTQIQRARRTMLISSPNFAFIRERYTQRVGVDGPGAQVIAPEPDPTEVWDTEWGGGIDIGLGSDMKPLYGRYRSSMPESTLTLEPVRVGVDESIDVRFRASLMTPWTWWSFDLIPDPVAEMQAFHNVLMLWAYPEPV